MTMVGAQAPIYTRHAHQADTLPVGSYDVVNYALNTGWYVYRRGIDEPLHWFIQLDHALNYACIKVMQDVARAPDQSWRERL